MSDSPVRALAALADDTRWTMLTLLGTEELSASALSNRMPVSRQAIAKHLAILTDAGLVQPRQVGREVRYQVLGARLSLLGHALDEVGSQWDRRLRALRETVEHAGDDRRRRPA